VSRRGLPPGEGAWIQRARAAIEAIEARGVRVEVRAGDVSDERWVAELVKELTTQGERVRGVVHAAGVSEVRALEQTDEPALERAVSGKGAGAWALHRATLDCELDDFIVVSSAASVWGSRGLAAYAAANGVVDAVAHLRRHEGRPALSINLGPLDGPGMAAGEASRWLARMGVGTLAPSRATGLALGASRGEVAQLTAAQVDWTTFRRLYEGERKRPLLTELALAGADEPVAPSAEATALVRSLHQAPGSRRYQTLLPHVQQVLRGVLRLAPDADVARQRGFFDMGLDSLMALDFAQRCQSLLGRRVPVTAVFEHPNLEAFTGFLLERVLGFPRALFGSPAGMSDSSLSIDAIAEMSNDEAERLLLERLASLGE